MQLQHRDELDGLRAIAFFAVVLNHAGLSKVGGIIGLDLFFVISGFLISRIVVNELAAGTFSFTRFYERRARRLIPALIPVVAFVLVAGYVLLLPDDYENLAQSAVATLLFANNVLLTFTSGYWDLASSFKPLLHTWSLGLEEQFYFAYPIAAVLVLKYRPRLFTPLLVIGIAISLGLSIALTPSQPDASYYLLHTRAWEFLLGALTAQIKPRVHVSEPLSNLLALAGLGVIFASIALIHEGDPYPSWRALAPCIGTMLILLFGETRGVANRILCWPPFVLIGLASYSIYLWHQPLFAFARTSSASPPGLPLMLALAVASILIGLLSWRFVEQPFRDRKRWRARPFVLLSIASTALLVAAGLAVHFASGLPQRTPGMGLERGDYAAYNNGPYRLEKDAFTSSSRPKLVVVGSSTARDLINAMIESGRFRDYEIIYRRDLVFCALERSGKVARQLAEAADAIIFVASVDPGIRCKTSAAQRDASFADKTWLWVGPKHFGYNLNYLKRIPLADRAAARASLLPETLQANRDYARLAPPDRYVDILAIMDRRYGGMPVFDAQSRILSADRLHLTQAGAAFFGATIFDDPAWDPVLALKDR